MPSSSQDKKKKLQKSNKLGKAAVVALLAVGLGMTYRYPSSGAVANRTVYLFISCQAERERGCSRGWLTKSLFCRYVELEDVQMLFVKVIASNLALPTDSILGKLAHNFMIL
jgi:hypothetical protein